MLGRDLGILLSALVLGVLALSALLIFVAWKRNQTNKQESFIKFVSRPFQDNGCFLKSKVPRGAQLLEDTNSVASSIHNYNYVNTSVNLQEPPKQGPLHSEDLFVDIDLNESSTNTAAASAKEKSDKIKEEDNSFVAKYKTILSDKFNAVKKKVEEAKTEKPKNIVYPLVVENENFSPSSLDFEDEYKEEPLKSNGRCRPLKNFDPQEDCYSDVPGLLKVSRGEELTIIQKDLGSGWTSVQNSELQVGFVPTDVLFSFE